MKKYTIWAAAMSFVFALAGCGGGGSSMTTETVTGLNMPVTLSVVSAKSDAGSNTVVGFDTNFKGVSAALLTDVGTDYSNDTTETYVWDESVEALQIVNQILCMIDQTGAKEMVNQGAYLALVNEDKCETGGNESGAAGGGGSSSGGGGSSSQVAEFEDWTILSTRADDSSPQIVHIWIPGDEPDPNSMNPGDAMDVADILVEVTVTEGVSATSPFGQFVLNFKGVIDSGVLAGNGPSGTMVNTMAGTLQTVANADGKPQFQFINKGGEALTTSLGNGISFTEASNVILDDTDGTSGIAKTATSVSFTDPNGTTLQNFSQSGSFNLAFNTSNLLKEKIEDNIASPLACLSRTNFNTQVWRYNLYHAADGNYNGAAVTGGQRVALNSGFPFTYNSKYGHVSYWGIWYEDDSATIPDGAMINTFDYSNDTTVPYTVNISGGKLHRRTVNEATLTSLQGQEFFGWEQHPTLSPGDPGSNGYDTWAIRVTTNNEFEIYAGVNWGDNGPTIADLGADVAIIPLTTNPADDGKQLWLWSDGLGGNIVYTHDSAETSTVGRTVAFYAEDEVRPNDSATALANLAGGVKLYCYDRCLIGGIPAPANQAAIFYPNFASAITSVTTEAAAVNLPSTEGGLRTYTLAALVGKLTLIDDTSGSPVAVTDLSGLNFNNWGLDSGEMVTTALINIQHNDVNSNPTGTSSSPWDVFNLAVGEQSYRWETGSNDWNRLVTVTDANGVIAAFDKPISIKYTHLTANDANANASHDSELFLLQYGGAGALWGFPWEVEPGCDTSTSNNDCRWRSAVTLKNGVNLNPTDTNQFVVKQIEREQTMTVLSDTSECDAASLDVTAASSLPLLTTVDTTAVTLTLPAPTVTDAPAVIEGEVQ